ncbi:hypothetical protein JKF63_01758 [Porcisia hertigi]|uniref:Uncharacterized protein n=1 Tax=Porcisia hertigi TaxID=2761500 RepID=A0A836L0D8_9TRYP|nr:hypothetical protein JKF63_01758 [Porcisia hertigi]
MPPVLRRVPPPPKEPGTHKNAEVKEALHARAIRRTVVVTAVVFLLLACLAVVSNTAREAVGNTGKPKMVILVVKGWSPMSVKRAMRSHTPSFMRLLSNTGGQLMSITANYSTTTPLINLLTGSAALSANTLANTTSILGWLRMHGMRTVVAAPATYWSLGTAGTTPCPQVGLLDTECSDQKCPEVKGSAYCNVFRKYITREDVGELYRDNIMESLDKTISYSADALYVQLDKLTEAVPNNTKLAVKERSEMHLLDSAVGLLSMILSYRTSVELENWLMIVTSDGDNSEKAAPLLVAVYTRGELAQLNDIATGAMTTDIFSTIKHWFGGSGVDKKRLLGICTHGDEVKNCEKPVRD